MTKFKLKITSNNIEIFQDGKPLAEGDNYKEVLAFIAETILEEDLEDDFEIYISEKGNTEKLENFDPKAIAKFSKKIKVEDDDEDDSKKSSKISKLKDRDKEKDLPKQFIYTPKYSSMDYQEIGLKYKDVLERKKIKEEDTIYDQKN
jgi:hypothetical protein